MTVKVLCVIFMSQSTSPRIVFEKNSELERDLEYSSYKVKML